MDRGVVLNGPGEPAAVEELTLEPPGPEEVQVRIEATGVCHSDLFIKQADGWGHRYPILLGHEGAGIVEDVGERAGDVAIGDRVVIAWRTPCGDCGPCRRGDPRRCEKPARARRRLARARDGEKLTQALLCGTFATRTIVHARAAVPVPPELPPEQACLLGCAVATGVCSVLHTARPWAGARVAVIGCGAVGLSAVQGARIAGAGEITAVDVEPRKLEWAQRLGATRAVHAADADELEVDFAYECVGARASLEQAVRITALNGTVTLIGIPQPGVELTLDAHDDLFAKRLTLRVSHGGDHLPANDFPMLARLALDGELDLAGMVTKEIALEDVERAFADMEAGEVIRSVIRL